MDEAGPSVKAYFETLTDAASDWGTGVSSRDYHGCEKTIEVQSKEDVSTQREKRAAFIGRPEKCVDMIFDSNDQIVSFDIALLQVKKMMLFGLARASMELFGREVIPKFAQK